MTFHSFISTMEGTSVIAEFRKPLKAFFSQNKEYFYYQNRTIFPKKF